MNATRFGAFLWRGPRALHARWPHAWWVVLAIPGLCQLGLLLYAVFARFLYPYDLEWMEGGILAHAYRIADGTGVYVEPSLDFVPFGYTPLYPTLVALVSSVFGMSYQVARGISILSMLVVVSLVFFTIVRGTERAHRGWALSGAALAVGVFAATYPWVEGWFDLVRGDMLLSAMTMSGIVMVATWARAGVGWGGHARIAVAAAVLALSFFCKQTGFFYVAAGGAILLVLEWRRVPIYVAVAGIIGLGGTWLLNTLSDGWYWTYTFKIPSIFDCNPTRFNKSFGLILWKFPVVTVLVAASLAVVGLTWAIRRRRPPSSGPLFLWAFMFAVSCVVGAVGWAIQWAHFNAYIPAMLTGGIAAGAAIPALAGAVGALVATSDEHSGLRRFVPPGIALIASVCLGAQLLSAWWSPTKFIPSAADRARGDRLIERIAQIDGDVFIPFHPWYGVLAGKRLYAHRGGVMNVTYVPNWNSKLPTCFWHKPEKQTPPPWRVRGLREALDNAEFAAIVWDNRRVDHYYAPFKRKYRLEQMLPRTMRPRTVTGAIVSPQSLWVPATPMVVPEGAEVLFDFEQGNFTGWKTEGRAWGRSPVTGNLKKARQGPVSRWGGRYFATSMHGGDKATGTLTSPEFAITGKRITFRMGGGRAETLRVELHADGQLVRTATNQASKEELTDVEWNVADLAGQTGTLVLVDEATGSWGHVNADEFWMWND